MQEKLNVETLKAEGGQLLERLKKLIEEGNVRRIVVKQGDKPVAEFPLTVGVVGALIAPALAAIGAAAALITDCSIDVVRSEKPSTVAAELPAPDDADSTAA
jgi:hypothetical protein